MLPVGGFSQPEVSSLPPGEAWRLLQEALGNQQSQGGHISSFHYRCPMITYNTGKCRPAKIKPVSRDRRLRPGKPRPRRKVCECRTGTWTHYTGNCPKGTISTVCNPSPGTQMTDYPSSDNPYPSNGYPSSGGGNPDMCECKPEARPFKGKWDYKCPKETYNTGHCKKDGDSRKLRSKISVTVNLTVPDFNGGKLCFCKRGAWTEGKHGSCPKGTYNTGKCIDYRPSKLPSKCVCAPESRPTKEVPKAQTVPKEPGASKVPNVPEVPKLAKLQISSFKPFKGIWRHKCPNETYNTGECIRPGDRGQGPSPTLRRVMSVTVNVTVPDFPPNGGKLCVCKKGAWTEGIHGECPKGTYNTGHCIETPSPRHFLFSKPPPKCVCAPETRPTNQTSSRETS